MPSNQSPATTAIVDWPYCGAPPSTPCIHVSLMTFSRRTHRPNSAYLMDCLWRPSQSLATSTSLGTSVASLLTGGRRGSAAGWRRRQPATGGSDDARIQANPGIGQPNPYLTFRWQLGPQSVRVIDKSAILRQHSGSEASVRMHTRYDGGS